MNVNRTVGTTLSIVHKQRATPSELNTDHDRIAGGRRLYTTSIEPLYNFYRPLLVLEVNKRGVTDTLLLCLENMDQDLHGCVKYSVIVSGDRTSNARSQTNTTEFKVPKIPKINKVTIYFRQSLEDQLPCLCTLETIPSPLF